MISPGFYRPRVSLLWIPVIAAAVGWSQAASTQDQLGLAVGLNPSARQASVLLHRWSDFLTPQLALPSRGQFPWQETLLFPMVAILAWLLAVLGWGVVTQTLIRRITQKLTPSWQLVRPSLETLPLGLLVSGLATFATGLIAANRVSLAWVLIAGIFVGLYSSLPLLSSILGPWRRRRLWGWLGWITLSLGAYLASLIWFAGVLPPVQSDAMRYHLAAPQEWLRSGQIQPLPLNAFSAFPFLPGMHYLQALAWDLPQLPALIHALSFLLCLTLLPGLVRGLVPFQYRQTAGFLSILIGMTIPCGLIIATWPFIDHFVTLYVLLVGRSLVRILRPPGPTQPNYLEGVFLGLWMGALLSTKYTALPILASLVPALVLTLTLQSASQRQILQSRILRLLPITLLALLLAGSPWYVRNAVHYGNPLYPALAPKMGQGDWTNDSAKLYSAKLAEKGDSLAQTGAPGLVTALWNSTLNWIKFEGHYLGIQWPLILLSSLSLFIVTITTGRKRKPPQHIIMPLWGAATYLAWAVTYQGNRMLLPTLFLLIPVTVAFLIYSLRQAGTFQRFLAGTVLGGVILQSTLWTTQWLVLLQPQPPLPYYRGAVSSAAYLSGALNYYPAYQYLASRSLRDKSLLVLHHGEHRIFHARHRALWSDWFDTPALLHVIRTDQARTISELTNSLARRQVTHILVNDPELMPQLDSYFKPRFRPTEWVLAESYLATLPVEWGEPGRVRILKVGPTAGPRPSTNPATAPSP